MNSHLEKQARLKKLWQLQVFKGFLFSIFNDLDFLFGEQTEFSSASSISAKHYTVTYTGSHKRSLSVSEEMRSTSDLLKGAH